MLAALRRAGEPYVLSPGRLLAQTLVTSGTMTNRIDRLESRGLVQRRPDPADRRGVHVRLTPQGEQRGDAALADLLERERELLAGPDAEAAGCALRSAPPARHPLRALTPPDVASLTAPLPLPTPFPDRASPFPPRSCNRGSPDERRGPQIQRVYLTLILGNTLAASFIWGINTLFLLDAGLSNFEAFAANAFFTAGWCSSRSPRGSSRTRWGRRASYLLGTVTLADVDLLYYFMWQLAGAVLGVGGRVGAPRPGVHVLLRRGRGLAGGRAARQRLRRAVETVFGRGQMVTGVAMLGGSVLGGVVAQATSLGVPFLMRVGVLLAMFVVASRLMQDIGFTPRRAAHPLGDAGGPVGLDRARPGEPAGALVMLAAPFSDGVGIYVFYALQPFLLTCTATRTRYSIAGLAARIVAGAQIAGGFAAPRLRGLFRRRTSAIILGSVATAVLFALLGLVDSFWLALRLLALSGLLFAASRRSGRAYLNDMIPSQQRATVLSFDSLMGSSGGVVIQPALGRRPTSGATARHSWWPAGSS